MPCRFRIVGFLAASLAVLAGCDPIRQISGTVRSVPPTTKHQDAGEVRPLSGVIVTATCVARPGVMFADPDEGARILAISRRDGSFEYVDIGLWEDGCVIAFDSGDGSHAPQKFAASDLCKRTTGDTDCQVIENVSIDLLRRREPAPPVQVSVRATAPNIELRLDESETCRTPCQVQVTPGLHRFELLEHGRAEAFWREQAVVTRDTELSVSYESHAGRQEAARWFLLPIVAAVILAPIGFARKNDALLWTSAGLAVGGGVGFALLWKSDDVDVSVQPTPRSEP